MNDRSTHVPTLQSMSIAELKKFRGELSAQIGKLSQAAASISDAAIRSSLIRNGLPSDATTDELVKQNDTDDVLATVNVLQETLRAQLNATDEELLLRRREKFERVQEGRASKAASLETSIVTNANRHLKNAEVAREAFLENVQQHNRFHESKVAAIRDAVEKSKEERFRMHLEQVREEEEKERRRLEAANAKQEARRAAFAKRAATQQQTLERFDQQRMAALQAPARTDGALVKDILASSAGARQVVFRQQAKSTSPDGSLNNLSRLRGTGAAGSSSLNLHNNSSTQQQPRRVVTPDVDSKWASLTRLPPRGIALASQLEKDMTDHLAKANMSKQSIAEMAREERERREARQDKLHDALYKQHEKSWAEKERRRQEAYARIDSLRQAQRNIPSSSPSPQSTEDQQFSSTSGSVRRQPPAKPLVDHAAIRARLLIASACEFVVSHQGMMMSLDHGPSIPKGFESSRR